MKKITFPKIKKHILEFLFIFVAIIAAFSLENWNENRKERIAESKILAEIYNGLEADIEDIRINIKGHEMGIEACDFMRKVIRRESVESQKIRSHFFGVTRDFASIQNTSGYETLKSRGLELLENDSLRTAIVSLYEYDYQTLRKLEEEYEEMQFQKNYFHKFNDVLAPNMEFDDKGNIVSTEAPLQLTEAEQKILLSYLWKIEVNRKFILQFYNQVIEKNESVQQQIEQELNIT